MAKLPGPNDRDSKSGRFLTGNSASPGRARGSRNKLAEVVFDKLLARLDSPDGEAMLDKIMKDEPAKLLAAIVALVPKQAEVEHNHKVHVTSAVDSLIVKLTALADRDAEYEADREAAMKTIEHEPTEPSALIQKSADKA